MTLMQLLKGIAKDDRAATAIEYGLIVSLVVIACIGAFDTVANENTGIWAVVSNQISDAMGEA